jgi:hypothetical protein
MGGGAARALGDVTPVHDAPHAPGNALRWMRRAGRGDGEPVAAVVKSFNQERARCGMRYEVTVHPGAPERDRCTCPSFRYGTGTADDGSCKHIRERRREVERAASARAAA